MVKTFFVLMALMFTGCAGYTYSDVKGGYVQAKIIYEDAKFVVHEIKDEVNATRQEFK